MAKALAVNMARDITAESDAGIAGQTVQSLSPLISFFFFFHQKLSKWRSGANGALFVETTGKLSKTSKYVSLYKPVFGFWYSLELITHFFICTLFFSVQQI